MIKYIFCDLDGTLYDNGIKEDDIEAIRRIGEKGIVFNIATGRIFSEASLMTKELIVDGYYICENGAYIYDKNYKKIFEGTIDDEIVKKVISRFESNSAYLYFKYDGEVILVDKDNILNKYENKYKIDEGFKSKENYKGLVGNIGIVSNDIEELYRIQLYLEAEFGEFLNVYFAGDNVVNLVSKGVSKRDAIEYICNVESISIDEIATIGDSPNDIDMLKGIQYSFAMKNARESVKEHANYNVKSVEEAINIIEKINGVE